MDARCNQFYNAFFRIKGDVVTRLCEDRALLFEDIISEINSINSDLPVILVGDGAELFYKKDEGKTQNIKLAPQVLLFQRATSVAILAEKKAEKGEKLPQDELLPFYLRLPQAERELKKRKDECLC